MISRFRFRRVLDITAVTAALTIAPHGACAQSQATSARSAAPASPEILRDSIPGTLIRFEMVRVPGGTVTLETPAGRRTVTVQPFDIMRTEVPWEMYDIYMLRRDKEGAHPTADAIARPSRPYAVPDYEWGHDGYAAISIAQGAARWFAEWLSAKTGHKYRLPTEAEWVHAATLATGAAPLTREQVDALAWHRGNSEEQTHPIGKRKADALGLFDLFGNAAEWVTTDDFQPVTRGGSFRDDPAQLGPQTRAVQDPLWTERDPQLPKSVWWLSDGPFVGFRLVREAQPVR